MEELLKKYSSLQSGYNALIDNYAIVKENHRVQAVAAHHAADGVGDQFLHRVLAETGPLLFVGELTAIAVGRIHREGNLLDRNIGREFVL